ncbi:MAG: recombinase family protein [Faecousia sp.]
MSPLAREATLAGREDAPKRCAIYIRVSTAMQRMEGWSLDAQRASLTAYAKSRGWKVVAVYADEGKTARKRLKDRKEIFRLLEDVKAGEIDVILFKELDRWFRNVSDFYKVQDVLDAAGVTWVSERQPTLDMTTKEGRLNVNVLLSVGQNEADSTSDRIKYTNKYMRQQHRWTSGAGNLPRGYTLDDDQHVIIDPEQEPFVRSLLDRFKKSGSVRAALLETNAEFGVSMHYNNAMSLLRNPLLCGDYMEVQGFVGEPYLTREEFDHIQSLIKRNARRNEENFYIFAGMVRCGACGRIMAGNTQILRGKRYSYYRCNAASIMATCPSSRRINEARMEQELLDFVRDALAARIVTVKAVQQARARKPRRSNREAIERQLDKLEDLYITSDRMTKEKYEEKRQAILAKLVDDEPEAPLPELADLEKIQALFDSGIDALYQGFTPEERREFWRGILNSVTVKDGQIVAVDFSE